MSSITIACLDMAGTTVADDGSVLAAFTAALDRFGPARGSAVHSEAMRIVHDTMGQSKIEVFREILGDEATAQHANDVFEDTYAAEVGAGRVTALPGAAEAITALCDAGIQVCLLTGFSPATRDAIIDRLGWQPLIDLALSPADAGRGRPWPDLPLTALLRLGGGAVSELAVVGDTPSDIETGRRAGAGLVAGVLTGRATRDELEAAKAPHVLDTIADLRRRCPCQHVGGTALPLQLLHRVDLVLAGAVGVGVVDLDAIFGGEVLHDGAVVGPVRREGDDVQRPLLLAGGDQAIHSAERGGGSSCRSVGGAARTGGTA
jgi:phosphonatase-like hydrolase